jgi:hypothetical protein
VVPMTKDYTGKPDNLASAALGGEHRLTYTIGP